MKIRTHIIGWAVAFAFCSCEKEQMVTENAEAAYLYARIAGQVEAKTRAGETDETGTRIAFKETDEIGLYTDDGKGGPGSLKTNSEPMQDVKNLRFTLDGSGKWQNDPLLKWKTDQNPGEDGNGEPADIYGYFPYQDGSFTTGGYEIFNGGSGTHKLKDVLVAERTTVENNNPAIFLTFKHRFALLKVKMGTGLEGANSADISVIMNKGIEDNAIIDKGTVDLQITESGVTNEFKAIKTYSTYCYIIVPVEKISETDSLEVSKVKIGEVETSFSQSFAPQRNIIYSVTVHRGEEGSISIAMGGIEEWGSDRHLGNIREKGGLYWHSDIVGLTNALNEITEDGRVPDKDSPLSSWGTWNETEGYWEFPVMRNIDMTEYTDVGSRNCCINEFYGVLDGRGYCINGLDIKGSGFIGTLKDGAEVKDLELKSITVDNGTSGSGTGALVGTVEDGGTIHNCSVTGTSAVKGGDNTGGLVGKGNPTMDRCSSNADVTGGSNTGGLIGELKAGGSISQSYTVGTVEATGNNVGGLAGSAAGTITNSHAGCDVKGQDNVGGLVGNTISEIAGCTATGYIEGQDIVGGLAGSTTSTVKQSGANGTVTGTGITGGLIGQHIVNGDGVVIAIEQSYSQSAVSGATTGGLIGKVTQPYIPEVPEVPGWEEVIEGEEGEEDQTIIHPAVPAIPAKGTEIIDCYATNGKILISNMTTDGISYSYQVEGSTVTENEKVYYTLPLTATPTEVDNVIVKLNNGRNPGLWIKGLIMIDGIAYMLPVLNYK